MNVIELGLNDAPAYGLEKETVSEVTGGPPSFTSKVVDEPSGMVGVPCVC